MRKTLACFSQFSALFLLMLSSSAIGQNTPAPAAKTVAERLGYPADARLLVLHADDFGMSHSANRAIMEALEKRWVTSASILVPCPWFSEVARWAKAHPDADLGIHLDLNAEWTTYRWRPVSPQLPGSGLLDEEGYLPLTQDYVVKHAKVSDVETELHAQIDKAQAAGIRLSHLDAHMGTILRTPEMFKVYLGLGQTYKLPLLLAGNRPALPDSPIPPGSVLLNNVLGIAPGVAKPQWMETYKKILAPLPPGTYELILHLGYNDEELQGATADHPDWGAEWRQSDFDLIRSAEFQKFLKDQGFILVTWKELAKALPAP